jgi:hypothetical protein
MTMRDGEYVQRLPRCHGEVAMADAIVALTVNQRRESALPSLTRLLLRCRGRRFHLRVARERRRSVLLPRWNDGLVREEVDRLFEGRYRVVVAWRVWSHGLVSPAA